MFFFHIILFLVSTVITFLKISLIRSSGIRLLYISFISILPLLFYNYAIKINSSELIGFFNTQESISDICLVLTIESIILMLLYIQFLLERENKRKYKIITLIPSWGFIGGIFISLVQIYNSLAGIAFFKGALYFSLLIFLISSIFLLLVNKTTSRETRLDIFIVCCFFQLIISTFLPLIINIRTSVQTNLEPDLKLTVFTILFSFVFIFIGKNIRKIKKLIKRSAA